MKALGIFGNDFRLYADSAVHRNHQPLFLPELSGGWKAVICPAIKISRLGTHLSHRFAGRYYDSVGVAAIFVPASVNQIPTLDEKYFAMDSAYAVGEFIEIGSPQMPHTISFGDKSISFSIEDLKVDDCLCRLSEFMTLKMGDLLMFAHKSFETSLNINDTIDIDINSTQSLYFKIK